jgi:hypothetical protein
MINGEQFYKLLIPSNDPITVTDPLNPSNNTTRTAFRISEILSLFRNAYEFIISKQK